MKPEAGRYRGQREDAHEDREANRNRTRLLARGDARGRRSLQDLIRTLQSVAGDPG